MEITVFANAKINLFLDVKSKRENNYHNIISIMQSLDLCDKITVKYTPSDTRAVTLRSNDENLPLGEDNLVYKAVLAFNCNGIFDIFIDKKIPVSAGLAGGSADAAATLIALNELTDRLLSVKELQDMGKKLGADIPFCIEGGTCIVEGIGDIVTKIGSEKDFSIVVARLGEGMSTPTAYSMLDEKFDDFKNYIPKTEKLTELICSLGKKDSPLPRLFNIFESVVEPIRPCVTQVKNIMKLCGATDAVMSGSGTSVFAVFNDEKAAREAVRELQKIGAAAFLSRLSDKGAVIV